MDDTLQVSPLTFTDFLEKMKDPKAADLVRAIKLFIASFKNVDLDGEACSQKVQAFLSQCESTFRSHPLWAGSNETGLEAAMEGLEKYIMTKLYDRCFRMSAADREGDELLALHLHALEFVKPEHLDIPDYFRNEAQWVLAQKELQKINSYKAPRDKLVCILNCCRVITNLLNVHSNGPAGADDFFPVLVYVVIRTNPPNLNSNLEYISRFRAQSRLVSEAAYFFTNTQSAAQFIQHINAASLSIDSDLFIARMTAAGVPLQRIQPPSAAVPVPAEAQGRQGASASSAQAVASRASALTLPADLPPLVVQRSVAELEAEGVGLMLEAEAKGQLRDSYCWLYSTASELTVHDVESLLASYKEVALHYEAITRAISAQSAVDLEHLAVAAPQVTSSQGGTPHALRPAALAATPCLPEPAAQVQSASVLEDATPELPNGALEPLLLSESSGLDPDVGKKIAQSLSTEENTSDHHLPEVDDGPQDAPPLADTSGLGSEAGEASCVPTTLADMQPEILAVSPSASVSPAKVLPVERDEEQQAEFADEAPDPASEVLDATPTIGVRLESNKIHETEASELSVATSTPAGELWMDEILPTSTTEPSSAAGQGSILHRDPRQMEGQENDAGSSSLAGPGQLEFADCDDFAAGMIPPVDGNHITDDIGGLVELASAAGTVSMPGNADPEGHGLQPASSADDAHKDPYEMQESQFPADSLGPPVESDIVG